MNERETMIWGMAYVSAMAIRLHPKNDQNGKPDLDDATRIASEAAFYAVCKYHHIQKEDQPCP